ncbi:hypothetical protein V7S76_04975 [Aquirufa sp. ROCK2-A2]
MKKLLLTSALLLFGLNSFANKTSNIQNLQVETFNDKIELKFDMGELNNLSKNQIKKLVKNFIEERLIDFKDESSPSVSVTFTGFVKNNNEKFTISLVILGTYQEIKKESAVIAKQILFQMKNDFE